MSDHNHSINSVNQIMKGHYLPAMTEQLYAPYQGTPLYKQEYPMSMEATIATERREARERARVEALYASFPAEEWFPGNYPLIVDWTEGDHNYASVRSANGKWTVTGSKELFADDFAMIDELVRRGLRGEEVRVRG